MEFVYEKIYPDEYTYVGEAAKGTLKFNSPVWAGDILNEIVSRAIVGEVTKAGGKMLTIKVWKQNTWAWLPAPPPLPTVIYQPTYQWYIVFTCFGVETGLGWILPLFAVVIAIVAICWAVGWVIQQAAYFRHGWPNGGGGPSIIGDLILLAGVMGIGGVGYIAYKTLQERKAITA